MARVGELLVAAGWITAEQCVQALNTQVLWGARLGTNLVELGFVEIDQVARALGRQFHCAPALSHHFAAADRRLQQELPVDMAERWSCLPLSRSKQGRLVIAAMAPLDDMARALIAHELDVRAQDVVVAVAAELRIRYQLERLYGIQRDTRFLRVRGPTPIQAPKFDINYVELEPELELPEEPKPAIPRAMARQALSPLGRPPTQPDLTPQGTTPPQSPRERLARIDVALKELQEHVERASLQRAPTRPDRRRYAPTIDESGERAVAKIPIKRLAVGSEAMPPLSLGTAPPPMSATLGEATRAIRCSSDREMVGELAIQAVAQFVPGTRAAVLLVVRSTAAIAQVGFSRAAESLPEVIVPLTEPGLVPAAIKRNEQIRAKGGELGVVDALVRSAIGAAENDDLVVTPISIGENVVGVIAIAVAGDEAEVNADSITAAAGAAYARLMRDASR